MAGRRSPVTDIRDLVRRLQLGEPDRRIARDLGVSRNTVARYREWAKEHGVLHGPLPDPATLALMLRPAPTACPAHEQSLVEPFRERVTALHGRGVEGRAIWQLLVDEKDFTGSYSSVKRFLRRLSPPEVRGTLRLEVDPGAEAQVDFGYAGELFDPDTGRGRRAWVFQADLNDSSQAAGLIARINESTPLHGPGNSAAIFEPLTLENTSVEDWEKHLAINLMAPFLLSQAFAKQAPDGARILNILDWRALRPGADHFPYTISKAALAAMTRSLAVALAPKIIVNGLALGAILPPSDGKAKLDIIKNIPAQRWAEEQEVEQALVFALTWPEYITGEIIHLDGGRHLI